MEPESDDALDPSMLSRETRPADALEHRTVGALHAAGLLASPRSRAVARWVAVAAGVMIFVGGLVAGRLSAGGAQPEPVDTRPRYILLLEPGSRVPTTGEAERRTVERYGNWAREVRASGRDITGERLGEARALVPDGPGASSALQGYFIISADSLDDAVAVARSCPHALDGGRIVVRPIDPT